MLWLSRLLLQPHDIPYKNIEKIPAVTRTVHRVYVYHSYFKLFRTLVVNVEINDSDTVFACYEFVRCPPVHLFYCQKNIQHHLASQSASLEL
jgi:hypothetical protein